MTQLSHREPEATEQWPPAASATATVVDGVLTIALSGDIDVASQAALYGAVCDILAAHDPRQITFDLAGVDFCDMSGARMLGRAHRAAATRGATVRMRAARPHIAWLLQTTGVLDH
jgi:anti-anti-sigma factor